MVLNKTNNFSILKSSKYRSRRGQHTTYVLAYQTKTQGLSPRPDIKTTMRKVFLRRLTLSRFLQKLPQKWPWSSSYCVGFLGENPEFEPQGRHQNKNTKTVSAATSSQQISGINSESKKHGHENFLENSVVRSRL